MTSNFKSQRKIWRQTKFQLPMWLTRNHMLNFVKCGINFPSFTLLKFWISKGELGEFIPNFAHNHVITITNSHNWEIKWNYVFQVEMHFQEEAPEELPKTQPPQRPKLDPDTARLVSSNNYTRRLFYMDNWRSK